MKAAVFEGIEDIKIREVATPECGPDGITVKVEADPSLVKSKAKPAKKATTKNEAPVEDKATPETKEDPVT